MTTEKEIVRYKKRTVMVFMTLCVTLSQRVSAADLASMETHEIEIIAGEKGGICEYAIDDGEDPDLFEKECIVIVSSVSLRNGPGFGYSAEGTMYQGDCVMVKSISGGWAKFNYDGTWKYVPSSALQKELNGIM